jgi:hypothetical protein
MSNSREREKYCPSSYSAIFRIGCGGGDLYGNGREEKRVSSVGLSKINVLYYGTHSSTQCYDITSRNGVKCTAFHIGRGGRDLRVNWTEESIVSSVLRIDVRYYDTHSGA